MHCKATEILMKRNLLFHNLAFGINNEIFHINRRAVHSERYYQRLSVIPESGRSREEFQAHVFCSGNKHFIFIDETFGMDGLRYNLNSITHSHKSDGINAGNVNGTQVQKQTAWAKASVFLDKTAGTQD